MKLPAVFGIRRSRQRASRAPMLAVVATALVVLVSCGDADPELPAEGGGQVEVPEQHAVAAGLTWVNQTGLNRTDATVWASRLGRACSEGLGNVEALAVEFIEADLEVSVRAEGLGPVSVLAAREAISISMRPVCPELFNQ